MNDVATEPTPSGVIIQPYFQMLVLHSDEEKNVYNIESRCILHKLFTPIIYSCSKTSCCGHWPFDKVSFPLAYFAAVVSYDRKMLITFASGLKLFWIYFNGI